MSFQHVTVDSVPFLRVSNKGNGFGQQEDRHED
jgi:hypothetical protein